MADVGGSAHKQAIAGVGRWAVVTTVIGVLTLSACGNDTGPGSSGSSSTARTTTPPAATGTAPPTSATSTTPVAGAWSRVPAGPSNAEMPAAWTGKELLVTPVGCCGQLAAVNLAGYDPALGRWRTLPPAPLTPRNGAVGTWTGTELIVAGGHASADASADHATPAADAAAWVEATNSWHTIASMPAALSSSGQSTAVWTGSEMLVWSSQRGIAEAGGLPAREAVMSYDPAADRWRSLPISGLAPRTGAAVVWTGRELFVWGGESGDQVRGDGARLDPADSTWRPLPRAPVPARGQMAAAWDGREVLLWGGRLANGSEVGKGAAYSPTADSWRALPLSPLRAKRQPAGVWTGRVFLVIGGVAGWRFPVPGPGSAAYDPARDAWTALAPAPPQPPVSEGERPATWGADQRAGAIAAWTGAPALIVGGYDFTMQGPRADGLAWTPSDP